jgi:subtilase family serine protease
MKIMFPWKSLTLFIILLSTIGLVCAQETLNNHTVRPPVHLNLGIHPDSFTPITPSIIRSVYGLPSTGGTGTIAIIDSYDDPSIQNDFNTFSLAFGLPTATAANFEIYKMSTTIQSATTDDWYLEEPLDVEWAHAIAPNAKILFVEATSDQDYDLLTAIDYARNRSDVVAISMSWGENEYAGDTANDYHFISPYGAVFFASSGDGGTGVNWPAVSGNVISVGGTSLTFDSTGQFVSESAWFFSGGGLSTTALEPSYQISYGVLSANGFRAVPDVSYTRIIMFRHLRSI